MSIHDIWMTVVVLSAIGFACFVFVIAFGAPFLPTLNPQVKRALDMIDLKSGDVLLELGSGDGRVLAAAAERGITAIGYELNPLLVIYSWVRTRKYGKKVQVRWANFWRVKTPQADGIFVFLLQPYMEKLHNKIIQEQAGHKVKLVSFAFTIDSKKPHRTEEGMFLYEYLV